MEESRRLALAQFVSQANSVRFRSDKEFAPIGGEGEASASTSASASADDAGAGLAGILGQAKSLVL